MKSRAKDKKKDLGSCVRKGNGGRFEKGVYGEGNAKETDGGQGKKKKGVEKPLKE